MAATSRRRLSWVFWPWRAVWGLVASLVNLTGRLAAILLGLGLMAVGIVVSATLIGAPLGIPLLVAGLLLIIRGLW